MKLEILCESLETEPKTQCKVCLSFGDIGIIFVLAGTSCVKEEGRINNSSIIRWTFNPWHVIKKGPRHGHRYGQKPGDRENYSANQLKKCKKKFFQGIHDRFIRDETFRSRVIENDRNEDVCRLMDALADEHHTHHLTSQEYNHYKNNWWLRSNKTGSDTVPVQRRSDFKEALSTLQQLKQRRRSSQKSTISTEFFFMARFTVDSFL